MELSLVKGTTSKIVHVLIKDSSVTTNAGLTGLAFGTASLIAYYIRPGDTSATAIPLVTAALGTWTSGGFKEVDAVHFQGLYEFGIPNACLASGANQVEIRFQGATNMQQTTILLELTGWNNQDAVHGGLSCLPAVAPGASGGVFIAGTNDHCTITNNLLVTGTTTFNGDTTLGGNLLITSGWSVGGTINFGGGWNVFTGSGNALTITGTAALGNAVFSSLTNNGATTLTGDWGLANVAIGGALTIAAGMDINNSTGDSSGLSITGNGFGSGIDISGGASGGDITLSQDGLLHGGITGSVGTVTNIVSGVWNALTSGMTTVGSIGKKIVDSFNALIGQGGLNAITIHVTDGTSALQGAVVRVFNGSTLLDSGMTDSSGNTAGSANNGTFTVVASLTGFLNYSGGITVSGSGTFNVVMTPGGSPIPPPVDPDMCTLAGYIYDTTGLPLGGVVVTATPEAGSTVTSPLVITTGAVFSMNPVSATSNGSGYVTLDVVRTDKINRPVTYKIVSTNKQINREKVRLEAATKNLNTL